MLGFLGGLNLQAITIIATIVISFGAGWTTNGWRLNNQINSEKIAMQKAIKDKEDSNQKATDDIRRKKDANISIINNQLVNALSELRQRPSRADKVPTNGQGCSGRSLYAEDSEFLIREFARADTIRTALGACYEQYDAIALPSK